MIINMKTICVAGTSTVARAGRVGWSRSAVWWRRPAPRYCTVLYCTDLYCTCAQLEGAFALVFKSVLYPGEVVATRRGSPLLVGGC